MVHISKNSVFVLALIVAVFGVGYLSYESRDRSCGKTLSDTLVVGTNATYPPFSFIQDGTITGYDIDIAREIARRLDKKIAIEDISFDALITKLQLGSIDIIASDLTPTPERSKQVLFSRPYFAGDPLVIISPQAKPIESIEQLTNQSVIVNQGYFADVYASTLPDLNLVRLETFSDAILALEANKGIAFITSKASAERFFKTNSQYRLQTTLIPDASEEYAIAISKKHPDLLECVNKVLENMEADGTIVSLQHKWGIA